MKTQTTTTAGRLEIDAVFFSESQKRAEQGPWIPAAGGTETPFATRSGRRVLYVWQPSTLRHAFLDLGTDLLLTDAEARAEGLA